MDNAKIYKRLAKSLAQLMSLMKMYKGDHPMVREKVVAVYREVSDFFKENKKSIVLAKSADMLLMNGEKVDPEDKLRARFVEEFIALDVGSIELEQDITLEEFSVFLDLMCQKEHISGADKIKEYLSGKKMTRLIARAATFRLVQEDENVVKKGDFIRVEELPPEVLERFSKDFKEGKIVEKLKAADKGYKMAAHDSTFLTGLTSDLLKEKNAPEDLEKILWLLADYLIDEIETAKEEDINRKVLEEIKKKLLSTWQEKPEKKQIAQDLEKTYRAIDAALQLKGLISLYKRHKKEVESVASRIEEILKSLPPGSQLYRKTIDNLIEIGRPSVNENIFKKQ